MSIIKALNKRTIGAQAETTAEKYLKKHGLCSVASNYHCRFGEIDIIMLDGDTLVFVEVRCRAEHAIVASLESITPAKVRKIRKTAEWYLMAYPEQPNCRFDVIAMTHSPEKIGYTIDWIKNAF